MIEFNDATLLFFAGVISGALNAVVGGGSFISFPSLIYLGISPIQANATSTVSLWLGSCASLWAQRKELLHHTKRLPLFMSVSLLGGAIGALILIRISNQNFAAVVPFLLLLATLLFSFRNLIINWARNKKHSTPDSSNNSSSSSLIWPILYIAIPQLIISIYGGFFGAGMGIMFLAFFGIIGISNIHEINAVRNCSAVCINSIASLIFILSSNVVWSHVTLLCIGAIIGGYFAAHYARKTPPGLMQKLLIIIAWVITLAFFGKKFL